MKRTLVAIMSLLVSSFALAESQQDRTLLEMGLIDNNYKFIDMDLAKEYFELETAVYVATLPKMKNSNVEVQTALFTPHMAQTSYHFNFATSEKNKVLLVDVLTSQETLKDSCLQHFIVNEYMTANDYTIIYNFKDIDNHHLAAITMNKANCDFALGLSD